MRAKRLQQNKARMKRTNILTLLKITFYPFNQEDEYFQTMAMEHFADFAQWLQNCETLLTEFSLLISTLVVLKANEDSKTLNLTFILNTTKADGILICLCLGFKV